MSTSTKIERLKAIEAALREAMRLSNELFKAEAGPDFDDLCDVEVHLDESLVIVQNYLNCEIVREGY